MFDQLLDTLKTGHGDIDDDHELIVSPLRDAWHVAKNKGDVDVVQAHMEKFIRLCEGHFVREERILTQAGYPDVPAHAAFHNQILAKVREIMDCFHEAKTLEDSLRCLESITGLFVDDIIKGDMMFVSFLQDKGLAQHRA